MSVLRPLPPRPSLEFDRKAAKALLREMRAGNREALERARAQLPHREAASMANATLSDAQLVIAREYGFASWPRLVQYYGGVARQSPASRGFSDPLRPVEHYERRVRSMLKQHETGYGWAARTLAAYVPKFFGMRPEELSGCAVTEDDARLAVARSTGNPSWAALLEQIATAPPESEDEWEIPPIQKAAKAIEERNLSKLRQVVAAHPELLHPAQQEAQRRGTILSCAIDFELAAPGEQTAIINWLVEQRLDLQLELNVRLCGRGLYMKPDEVRALLKLGANPNWVAPNGIPVIEHAIVRYWNGESIDVLKPHVKPRKALWISAGLGDVDGLHKLLDRNGKPTAAARVIRAPLDSVCVLRIPPVVDPDDEELFMEALFIAALNGRTNVIEYLASRGVNINSLVWGAPVISTAVGNGWTPVVETLVRCGADVNLKGWSSSNGSARDQARSAYEHGWHGPSYRRIVELCGLDPDAILAERDATPPTPAGINERMRKSLAYAMQDAVQQGNSVVSMENLLFGMFRFGQLAHVFFTRISNLDRERFNDEMAERVQSIAEPDPSLNVPLQPDVQAILDDAITMATERRADEVNAVHVLYAMTRAGEGFAVELLKKYGGDLATLNKELRRSAFGANA